MVPVALAAKLRRSHFLFLGYEMADWNLRVILSRIWGERPIGVSLVGRAARRRARSPRVLAAHDVEPLDVEPEAYVGAARAAAGGAA